MITLEYVYITGEIVTWMKCFIHAVVLLLRVYDRWEQLQRAMEEIVRAAWSALEEGEYRA